MKQHNALYAYIYIICTIILLKEFLWPFITFLNHFDTRGFCTFRSKKKTGDNQCTTTITAFFCIKPAMDGTGVNVNNVMFVDSRDESWYSVCLWTTGVNAATVYARR